MRSPRGVNPKLWFYGLRDAMRSEESRPCVLAGAACEQWINAELFRVIAAGLGGTGLTAYPEWNRRQHDVAVLQYRPSDPTAWKFPVAIIECKVVYSNYSLAKRARYLDRLLEQASASHAEPCTRVGFLIGIYAYWCDYRSAPKESFQDFRQSLTALFRNRRETASLDYSIQVDHEGVMETFLDRTESTIGDAKVVVGCVAQYFRLCST